MGGEDVPAKAARSEEPVPDVAQDALHNGPEVLSAQNKQQQGISVLRLSWHLWPLLLGNVMEWYEFSIYAYLAPQIKSNFFPGSTYGVWLGFAITFLSRPLGGVTLGWVGDRVGRRVALNLSIVGMLVATVCQGLLPSYHSGSAFLGSLGFLALLLLRVCQGLSAGGEAGTITTYLFEAAPLDKIGRLVVLMPVTGSIAYLLASAAVEGVLAVTNEEQMLQWGWRIPFILSLPPGILTIWGRRCIPESELFLREMQERSESTANVEAKLTMLRPEEDTLASFQSLVHDLKELIRQHGLSLIVVIGYLAGPSLGLYVATMWIISYLQERGLTPSAAFFVSTFGRFLAVMVQFLCGWLIDKRGIGWVTVFGSVCFMLLGLPGFLALDEHGDNLLVAILGVSIGYSVVTAVQCPQMFCAELFPTRVRSLALGLSWNIAVCLFGGFGSIMAEASLQLSPLGPGWLMSGCAALSLASVLLGVALEHCGLLHLAHRRVAPYWGQAAVQGFAPGVLHAAPSSFTWGHSRPKKLQGYVLRDDVPDVPAAEEDSTKLEVVFA